MLIAVVGAFVVVGLTFWFVSLEMAGRRHGIFVAVVVVALVEAVLAGGGAQVPIGILRPSFFGQDFRIADGIILAALAARVLVTPWRRVGPLTMVWAPFVAFYALGSVIGFINGWPPVDVLFQSKPLFYLVGVAVVAYGADLRRVSDSMGPLVLVLAPLVPIALAIRLSNTVISLDIPLQRLPRLGLLSNDTISVLVAIGAGALLVETVRESPRLRVAIAAVVLMLAPLSSVQRASYLSLLAVLLVLALVVMGPTWRRRSNVSPAQVALGLSGLVGVVLFGLIVTGSPGVLVAPVEDAFGGVENTQSASARISISDAAIAEISERPWIGWGVGTKVTAQVEQGEVVVAGHNILLDLPLRVGLIGLGLFSLAIAATVVYAVRSWRSHWRHDAAALAVVGVVMIASVLAKSLVEPALERYRLSTMLGVAIGIVAASYSQRPARDDLETTADEHSAGFARSRVRGPAR